MHTGIHVGIQGRYIQKIQTSNDTDHNIQGRTPQPEIRLHGEGLLQLAGLNVYQEPRILV